MMLSPDWKVAHFEEFSRKFVKFVTPMFLTGPDKAATEPLLLRKYFKDRKFSEMVGQMGISLSSLAKNTFKLRAT